MQERLRQKCDMAPKDAIDREVLDNGTADVRLRTIRICRKGSFRAVEMIVSRRWLLLVLALWSGCPPVFAEAPAPTRQRAGEVDTEHLFGQTVGADTEEPGAFVPHFVLPARLGRRSGSFAVTSPTLELKYGLMENFSGSLSLRGLTANTHNVPGMADTRGAFATGFGIQGRYRFLDRERAPFGMTLQVSATTDQRNMGTGERGRSDQIEGRLAFDIEPIWDRLLFAGNIIMASGRTTSRAIPASR